MINRRQCSNSWYDDDPKISHVNPAIVDSITTVIEESYREKTITRGKKHTYVGMYIDYVTGKYPYTRDST